MEKGILLLSVGQFTKKELELGLDGKSSSDFSLVDRIGGGTIGCDKESLDYWNEAYYSTVMRYLEKGKFIGKDQSMMATTCIETDMCLLVEGDDDWFAMQRWFRGEDNFSVKRLNVTHLD